MIARAGLVAPVVALALAAAGCGGDDKPAGAGTAGESTSARTVPAERGSRTAPSPTDTTTTDTTPGATDDHGGRGGSPEKQPGGAGDEVPNATQALVTGRGGRLSPSTISAPPFIAIQVELRSADGLDYSLSGGGRRLHAGEGENSASATFGGLHKGGRLVLSGPSGRVVISATARPGP